MPFTLPPLPYDRTALEPHMSAETIDYHYGKHHQAYVTNLNGLVAGTDMDKMSLEDVIRASAARDAKIFNNAAQIWNHTFFWESLAPQSPAVPKALASAIDESFGSFAAFREAFLNEGKGHFGSGWAWLVKERSGKLAVVSTHDAHTPLTGEAVALFVIDVWEHAYYIDRRNDRGAFLSTVFDKLANWDKVAERLAAA